MSKKHDAIFDDVLSGLSPDPTERPDPAERGGAVLGFLAIRPADALLCELFLWPDCRGQGIGGRLLAHAKARMPGGFRLFTRPSNRPAIRFYEAAGLTLSHETVHPHFGDRILWYRWTPDAR